MADGPDPNRFQEEDPDSRGGRNIGDLPATRFYMNSWVIAIVALLILAVVLGITIY